MVRCGWDMSSPANKLESSGILNYRLIDRFGKARFASIKPHSVNALCSAFNKNALYGENEMVSIPVNPLQPGLFSPSTCWCQGLAVCVQPNAKATETMGEFNGALKVRLNAPPVDGKANQALCAWLAERLGVPRHAVYLEAGHNRRYKKIRITAAGLDAKAVRVALSGNASSVY